MCYIFLPDPDDVGLEQINVGLRMLATSRLQSGYARGQFLALFVTTWYWSLQNMSWPKRVMDPCCTWCQIPVSLRPPFVCRHVTESMDKLLKQLTDKTYSKVLFIDGRLKVALDFSSGPCRVFIS